MMLRKRSRSVQKDQSLGQLMADSTLDSNLSGGSQKTNRGMPFFTVPGLFIGFNSKCQSDCDAARSPTSPLDYKVLTNLGNPFVRSPRSSPSSAVDSPRKSWDCNRVGLGLLDSLTNDPTLPAENKNLIFGSNLRINVPTPKTCLDRSRMDASASATASPKSLPKNYMISSRAFSGLPVVGATGLGEMGKKKIQSCSADIGRTATPSTPPMYLNPKSNSGEFSFKSKKPDVGASMEAADKVNFAASLPVSFDSAHGFLGALSASDIENSEDYTRIISRGPNPKTTHIFGDCVLESHAGDLSRLTNNGGKREVPAAAAATACEESSWPVKCSSDGDPLPSPPQYFLSSCYSCKKKLVEGEDIYIYRGEKAFCSFTCRAHEILIDEESDDKAEMSSSDSCEEDEIFLAGGVGATA